MRTPTGFRADSQRSPKASRAGALHRYSTLRNYLQDQSSRLTTSGAFGDWPWT